MWRRTEELKPSSPGADAAEPAATTPTFDTAAIPRAETAARFVPAAPVAAAFNPTPAAAPDVAAAINAVSTISAGLKIRGDISGRCPLVIEGEGHGNADNVAPEIIIHGHGQGNLQARDSVRLGPASHVQGSVLTPRIRIEDGAGLRGKVEMARPGHSADSSGSTNSAAAPVDAEVSSKATA